MTTEAPAWPRKTREMRNHHMDSSIWDEFLFRDDDIVIATYGKSGTTWLQQIVGQLLFNGDPDVPVADISPWVDLRVPAKEEKLRLLEAQTHRRFLKTHLPVNALVYSPQARYIFIGRDGRDIVWSMHNHHANANEKWYRMLNDTPGRVGPPIEPPTPDRCAYFRDWLHSDGYPFWPFWESIRSWWAIRDLPNMMLVHYANLKADMPGQIRRIAAYLDIPIDESRFPAILEHCTFCWMKANATKSVPLAGAFWDAGAAVFINKGERGQWREELDAADSERYERRAVEELGPQCAHWLATGELPVGG